MFENRKNECFFALLDVSTVVLDIIIVFAKTRHDALFFNSLPHTGILSIEMTFN